MNFRTLSTGKRIADYYNNNNKKRYRPKFLIGPIPITEKITDTDISCILNQYKYKNISNKQFLIQKYKKKKDYNNATNDKV